MVWWVVCVRKKEGCRKDVRSAADANLSFYINGMYLKHMLELAFVVLIMNAAAVGMTAVLSDHRAFQEPSLEAIPLEQLSMKVPKKQFSV